MTTLRHGALPVALRASAAMHVLLINPNREQMPWPAVPVGLCTVASSVAAAGHDVELLDLAFSRNPARATRGRLRRSEPDVIAV
ncbi:MAG TPA: hypothetical protein VGP93_05385, partial [Polyangiaceae bacterium]|nr:hypothetical protein [Polyangiaceae bacterium]